MLQSKTDIICEAIKQRRELSFSYKGQPRRVLPAALGRRTASGSLQLRAYQVGGVTGSGRLPLWRLYEVATMLNLQKEERGFDSDPPGYEQDDLMLSPVLCQLE